MCTHEKLRTEVLLPHLAEQRERCPDLSPPPPQAQAPGVQTAGPPAMFPQGNKCSRTAARAEVREKNISMLKRKPAAKEGHGFSHSKLPDHGGSGGGGKNGHRAGRGLGKPSP